MLFIDNDHMQRQEEMAALDKSIQNKKSALKRRIGRMQKQQRIAQNAANEKKDSNELKMQENFLAQKFYSNFLKHKMDREMKANAEYEQAFQKIRAQTGYSDVQEIVQKFLKREETYNQLLESVSNDEAKIDNLRRENDKQRDKLHELQIQQSENNQST